VSTASFYWLIWLSVRCPRLSYGLDCEKLKSTCDNLGALYSSDVDGKQLYENIPDCKMLFSSANKITASLSPHYILRIVLQKMLTMAVSISREQSFSKPKLSYLRVSMTKNKSGRLCDLALMTVERGILCKLVGKGWIY